jgi:hypothetical protein
VKQLHDQVTRYDALVCRTPALVREHGICDMLSSQLYTTPGAPVLCILNCCMQAKVVAMKLQENARLNITDALQVRIDTVHVNRFAVTRTRLCTGVCSNLLTLYGSLFE